MKWFRMVILVGLCLVTLALVFVAAAQSGGTFEISTSTIDTGGRYSAGGPYWVGGTIGQPDSGVHTGGDFELTGGFWHIKQQYPTAIRLLSFTAASNSSSLWLAFSAAAALLLVLMVRRRMR